MWTAAFMTNTTTRDMFIDSVYKYAADGANNVALSDWYDTRSGVSDGFKARPVVGGHLALVSFDRLIGDLGRDLRDFLFFPARFVDRGRWAGWDDVVLARRAISESACI